VKVESFDLEPGRILARKYEVVSRLGSGWEGEVYKIRELGSGIERAAKLFFPHRNVGNRVADTYARKLHRLRECPIVIQYHQQETLQFRRTPVTVLISEYVEGVLLSDYLSRQRGRRLHVFQAIHLLHALAVGIESIHHQGEYHGDLHSDNIIVRRLGLSYELKLLDFFHLGRSRRENRRADICDVIRIFYDALGGQARYRYQPREVKTICCGLKRSLILDRFPTASSLRVHLETQAWT
jgi:tRNA A-37 threonylcarbamoyl transferase component Bud32